LIALAWLPSWRMASALRVAVVLPAILVAAIVVGWAIWNRLAPGDPSMHISDEAPLARELPLGSVVVLAGVMTIVVARAIAWRRRREWLHAAVMLSLVHLLVAGIATSIAAASNGRWSVSPHELHKLLHDWPTVLVTTFVLAAAFTLVAIRSFERLLE